MQLYVYISYIIINKLYNYNKMNIHDFISEKLENMYNWILDENIIDINHPLITQLTNYVLDTEKFINLMRFVPMIINVEDVKNERPYDVNPLLVLLNLKKENFTNEQLEKFKRYFECFLSVI